jgi:hypothetical protein
LTLSWLCCRRRRLRRGRSWDSGKAKGIDQTRIDREPCTVYNLGAGPDLQIGTDSGDTIANNDDRSALDNPAFTGYDPRAPDSDL